ncbi:MAG: glycosyltransferase [Planctomycetota bacterium]|nr:glycosyltransferase [Planctomycetota bacterium]
MSTRSRILFVTPNIVGADMAGVGMRHFEIAKALSGEFDVCLAVPKMEQEPIPGVPVRVIGNEGHLSRVVAGADVLILQGDLFRRYPSFRPPRRVPVVIDMVCPVLLEDLEGRRGERRSDGAGMTHDETLEHEDLLRMVNHLLRIGDFFLVGSERQRDLILGMLLALSRLNPLNYRDDPQFERLVDLVPYGLPDEPPVPEGPGPRESIPGIGRDDLLLYWGGGLWNWLDPVTVIEAMRVIANQRADIKLLFAGTCHPDPGFPDPAVMIRARRRATETGLAGKFVFFNSWVPYQDRASFLIDADVGVSAHRASVETRFAVRTRILDYLWAGLPIITTEGDEAAQWVQQERLGEVVAYGDVAGWVSAILRLAKDPRSRKTCGERARRTGASRRWSDSVRPLVRFCRRPARAADHGARWNGRGRSLRRYGGKAIALASEGKFRKILEGARRLVLERLSRSGGASSSWRR